MEAVAVKPRKKQRADRVEPITDTESEVSGPSTSQRPGSAWSAKDEDIINTFAASDPQITEQPPTTKPDENESAAEDRSSVGGSRGMLQKMKKNFVVPVDTDISSESSTTRINVAGKREVPGAWDNNGHEADDDSNPSSSRPTSAPLFRQPKAPAPRPTSAPQSKLAKDYRPLGRDGPYQMTKKEVISESEVLELDPQRPSTSHDSGRKMEQESGMIRADTDLSRPTSQALERVGSRMGQLSTGTASSNSMLAPPVASGEHQAYIPYEYAKECIARVVDNMKRMKSSHVKVVENIQDQYAVIEEHTQGQFNDYVLKLRLEYNEKVNTFRKIIEIHQAELERSQNYWQSAVMSLKEKNKLLMEDKRRYLKNTHERFDSMEDEKLKAVKGLAEMLDKRHVEYLAVVKKLKEEEKKLKEEEQKLKEEQQKRKELEREMNEKAEKETEFYQQKSNEMADEKKSLEEQLEEKNVAFVALEGEKSNIQSTLQQTEEQNSALKASIEELEMRLKEIESRPVASIGVVTSDSVLPPQEVEIAEKESGSPKQQQETMVTSAAVVVGGISSEESKRMQKKIEDLEKKLNEQSTLVTQTSSTALVVGGISLEESEQLNKKIEDLENKLKEKEKSVSSLQAESEEAREKIVKLRTENGNHDVAMLDLQRENQSLKERLKVAIAQMTDSVDTSDVEQRLNAADDEKGEIRQENEKYNETLQKWMAEFREEHDGHEPTEEDRTGEIQGIMQELNANNEKLGVIDADIGVMKLLLGAPVEEAKTQQDTSSNKNDELIRKLVEEKNSLLDEVEDLKHDVQVLNANINNLQEANQDLKSEKLSLEERIEELESRPPTTVVVAAEKEIEVDNEVKDEKEVEEDENVADESPRADSEEQIRTLELQRTEFDAQISKINAENEKLQASIELLTKERDDSIIRIQELEGKLANEESNFNGQLELKQKELDSLKKKVKELEKARLSSLPVDTANEIKAIQAQLKLSEEGKEAVSKELLDTKATIAKLNLNVEKTNKTLEKEKERSQQLQTEKKKLKEDGEKKVKELEQKIVAASVSARKQGKPSKEDTAAIKTMQKKVDNLEKQLAAAKEKIAQAPPPVKETREPKGPSLAEQKLTKENEKLNEKIEAFKKASKEDREKVKTLQGEVRDLKEKVAKAGPSAEDRMAAKKQEKQLKDLQKTLETEKKRTDKLKGDLTSTEEELAQIKKDLNESNLDVKKKTEELSKLGVAAKQGAEAMEKVVELETKCSGLVDENKTLVENYNSERILRKKYYNMVEDMKGKIRVYARCRPLSKSEIERGNYSVTKSPDEYTIVIDTARGPKEFQYDSIFMPDTTQERVFEDTSNLIQSAVDGYNVCIFAYGQTGSGKTFTVIGDKERKFPGIAPRAFDNVFSIIEENKQKFSFKVELYMLELYMDRLIDLFGTQKDAKLDIKKDKKGMVVVSGAVVQQAHTSDELMELFEKGSSSRHVASTKMNAESSRSHLVISIVIESTNLASGAVTKGKLSLVDLAGSERAAKTEASPEQLKEAQSINKSLSALGDVISALSSEQSFIPYRNNKLTMLMQDSLGGNAKTLMFVNISPADYNTDETITSLTYASRVKLITNDASKNAESKEINRLKGIISKLKKGEHAEDEELE